MGQLCPGPRPRWEPRLNSASRDFLRHKPIGSGHRASARSRLDLDVISGVTENIRAACKFIAGRLGGVVGLSLAFCTQVCGFDQAQVVDAENRQRPCRMIIRHEKDNLSVHLTWMLTAKLNPSTVEFQLMGGQNCPILESPPETAWNLYASPPDRVMGGQNCPILDSAPETAWNLYASPPDRMW
ncbi:hypothetical protein TNCV_2200331 [Trichonephila clavipes]|nr:hypothetical protein TNCV_2200331 [Trichonephila clavipes]